MRLRAEKLLSASQDPIGEVTPMSIGQLSHIGEDGAVAIAHRQRSKGVLWAWRCILRVGNPHVGRQEHPILL